MAPGRRFESYIRHRLVSPGNCWAMVSNAFFGPKVTLFQAESHTFLGQKSHFFGPKITLLRAKTFRAEFCVAVLGSG
jgi:hypothetical protein